MSLRLTLAAAALIGGVPTLAQSRDMRTVYMIQPVVAPAGVRELGGGDFVLKQPLLPLGLAELSEPLTIKPGQSPLPVGTQLIQVQTQGVAIYCVAARAAQKLVGHGQSCLVDADGDSRFEGFFLTTSATKGILTIQGVRPKLAKSVAVAAAYAKIDPSRLATPLFVAIERTNYFNIYGRENFMIAYGADGEVARLTSPISIKASELPKELTVLGARFTAISETSGRMSIRVDAPMPAQPFGVVMTTTYRVY